MNRRYFLKSGGIALASIGVMTSAPTFLKRALAETIDKVTGGRRKTLIAIFQRGAVDGLNVVVPCRGRCKASRRRSPSRSSQTLRLAPARVRRRYRVVSKRFKIRR